MEEKERRDEWEGKEKERRGERGMGREGEERGMEKERKGEGGGEECDGKGKERRKGKEFASYIVYFTTC